MILLEANQREKILQRIKKIVAQDPNSMSMEGAILQAQALCLDQILQRHDPFEDVVAFHKKFGIAYSGPPRNLPADYQDHRIKCLREEISEYEDAVIERDLEKQFDALIDLIYFALGGVHLHGFPFQEGWRRVHAKNMEKVRAKSDGSNSKRGHGCDVVKPEGWTPPDLSDLVIEVEAEVVP